MSKRIDQKIKMGRRSENLSVPLGLFLSFSDTSQPALPPHCGRPLKRGSGLSAWPPLHPLPGAHVHSHHSSPCDTQTRPHLVLQPRTSHFFPWLVLGYFHMEICLAQPEIKIGIHLPLANLQPFPTPLPLWCFHCLPILRTPNFQVT